VAFDERRYCPVVVKIVRPHLVADAGTLRGLRREVDLVGQLNHPVVVRGFHADVGGDRPYVALEHLQGPRLSTLLRKSGSLQPEQYLPLALQLSAALHYLAAEGVVHLDVKPSNIVIEEDTGRPVLVDFGLSSSRTSTRRRMGTSGFAAPELVATGEPSRASDVYSLAATAFALLTGEAPTGVRPSWEGIDPEQAAQLEADRLERLLRTVRGTSLATRKRS